MDISKFEGTRKIGEHTIVLPEPPPLHTIDNYNLPKEKQKFRVTEVPKDFKNWEREARREFIRKEWHKRNNGYWFLNNGNIEYITGVNYFYINYWRLNTGLPMFTDSDRDFFYVWDHCVKTKTCDGLIYITHRGEGKALDINTPIPTLNGWKKMLDINIGDVVFGSDGMPTNVTYVSPIRNDRQCYEVLFSDDSKIIADEEHLWIAQNKTSRAAVVAAKKNGWNYDNHNYKVVTTKHIFETQKYLNHESNWSIDNCKPVNYPTKELQIPPYILGLWLGDGTSSNTGLTNIDEQLIQSWKSFGDSIGLECRNVSEITYNLVGNITGKNNIFRSELKRIGVFNNKHIPSDYLQSNVGDRFDLLCGIMDTDGSVNPRGTCLELCTKSELLAKGYKELIVSLGYKVKITTKLNKKYNKIYYYLRFSHNQNPPFKLQRKLDKIKYNVKGGWDSNLRYITSVKKVESVSVKCIAVDNSNHSYLCGENFIVTHNTYKSACIVYETISKMYNAKGGIQSKNEQDAKKVFQKLVFSWSKLPYFFKPIDIGLNRPIRSLEFFAPSTRNTKSQDKEDEGVLNSLIDFESAKVEAYDGDNQKINFQDEIGKCVEANVDERLKIVRECLRGGRGERGKIIATTTVEELEKYGGKYCKLIWDKSSATQLDENGFTQSGLYRYFKPSYYGYLEVMNGESFVDEYGYALVDKTRTFFENKRKALKGADLSSEKRKYPFEEKECWITDSKKSAFDTHRIEEQLEYNKSLPLSTLIRGNFQWKDGIKDTEVVWHPSSEGKWKVAWLPKFEDRNKFNVVYGKKSPANTEVGCIGLDPFDNRLTVDNRKSDAAAYGFLKFNPLSPYDTGIFIFEYINRPPLPETMWEDQILSAVFFGWEILIESNKIGTINHFRMRGYEKYLMERPSETKTESNFQTKKEEEKGIAMSGEEPRLALIYATQSYVSSKVGLIEEEGKDPYMGKCYFDPLLYDWLEFDIEMRWTKFDKLVGAGLALLGARKYVPKKIDNKPIELFQRYRATGMGYTAIK